MDENFKKQAVEQFNRLSEKAENITINKNVGGNKTPLQNKEYDIAFFIKLQPEPITIEKATEQLIDAIDDFRRIYPGIISSTLNDVENKAQQLLHLARTSVDETAVKEEDKPEYCPDCKKFHIIHKRLENINR